MRGQQIDSRLHIVSRDYSSHFSRKIHADQSVDLWAVFVSRCCLPKERTKTLETTWKRMSSEQMFFPNNLWHFTLQQKQFQSLSRDDTSMFGDDAFWIVHVATDDEITSATNHVKCQANIFQSFLSSQLFGTKLENLIKTIWNAGMFKQAVSGSVGKSHHKLTP